MVYKEQSWQQLLFSCTFILVCGLLNPLVKKCAILPRYPFSDARGIVALVAIIAVIGK
jgi:hypothetical protein